MFGTLTIFVLISQARNVLGSHCTSLGGGLAQAWVDPGDGWVEGPLGPPVPGTWAGQP